MYQINLGYNRILVYNEHNYPIYVNSNLDTYDIHPWHTPNCCEVDKIAEDLNIKFPYILKPNEREDIQHVLSGFGSQDLGCLLDNSLNSFKIRQLEELYRTKEFFIYPIITHTMDIFKKYNTIDFDEKLIKCVKNKQAKILISQLTEGFFGEKEDEFIWMSNLSKRYNFDREDLIILTSNMICDEVYNSLVERKVISDNFTVFPYSYFSTSIWFQSGGRILDMRYKNFSRKEFNDFISKNKTIKKDYHFLAFNRVVKEHRIAIFSELMSNPHHKGKFITSICGGDSPNQFSQVFQWFYGNIENVEMKNRIMKFLLSYDCTKHYVYDESDLENNKAHVLNKDAHSRSFVNIVTESLLYDKVVFYSEKTFKPIAAAQPFILYGNPYSLRKLKELGYKTFGDWWDESYDNEIDKAKRFEKIALVMEEISSWSLDKCFEITNEMTDVLTHNFNNFINNDRSTYKLYDLLSNK